MDQSLPAHLAARTRWWVEPQQSVGGAGAFVLYWMHNALRAEENPALDVALVLARQNGLPLLVYHALSENYPYASDRLHAFLLQGHRDVQRQLADRGIRAVFQFERDGNRGPFLRELTRQSAVLVTEEMPVEPLAGWMERVACRTRRPIVMVDASCVLPVGRVLASDTQPHRYREVTQPQYAQLVTQPYPVQPVDCERYDAALPFTSLDLQDVSLAELIGQCRIDHSIAPVADTPGGSRAGYARWERFKQQGLGCYHRQCGDAASPTGVSRLSAYLHFGMVSPLRIAREAAKLQATDFLNSLLIHRESAFHFCFHHPDLIDSLDALPTWAHQSLHQHASDPREHHHSWEVLVRGKTGQPLWDAAQRSLLKHGELHPDVRMTWGNAMLPWTQNPALALRMALDLNHRYALDGADPGGYTGVLSCFGKYDSPVTPPRPVFGAVPERSMTEHQQRIDCQQFYQWVDRPIAAKLPRVAIIGAGIGGLIAARTLLDHGLEVTVLEKSRGVGGRLATRRLSVLAATDSIETSDRQVSFDHGAQYFTARDKRFIPYVRSWIDDGVVQPWLGRIVELQPGGEVIAEKRHTQRYVGVGSMNRLAQHLAAELTIRQHSTVTRLASQPDGGWQLWDDQDQSLGSYDAVIVNCPAPQTLKLIRDHTEIAQQVAEVSMQPCWTVMLCAPGLDRLDFDGAFINEGPLSWIARNRSKPGHEEEAFGSGSSPGSSWVLQASSKWSQRHLEESPQQVQAQLLAAVQQATRCELGELQVVSVHRWRYANVDKPLLQDCLWDPHAAIGVCGDWCGGPRIEGAFLSGMAAAGALLRTVTIDRKASE